MKIDASTYKDAALEHIELARELYESGRYVGSLYIAGVSVECLLRSATPGMEFDARHDLRVLLRGSGLLNPLNEFQAERISAAVGTLWARWRNTHRYFSTARLKQYLVSHGLHHRIKGDVVKENTRIALSSAYHCRQGSIPVDPLIQKLTVLLGERFPGSKPEIEPTKGNGRVWGVLLWPQFEGEDQLDRQSRVWKVLRTSLSEDERRRVAAILTMTPAEVADE